MKRVALTGAALLLAACSREPAPTPAAPAQPPVAAAPAPPAAAPAAESTATSTETWELPGGLHPLTTRLELEARFGKANVRQETFAGAEGIGSHPALVVFPDDPGKRLELVLDADNPDAPIRALRVASPDSRWHAASGLHPGMALERLVALNAAPVSFYGLAWDYGGTVQDWHGGRLANAVGKPLFHGVVLGAADDATGDALPTGDGIFRSDDPSWPDIGRQLVVRELSISWPHEGEE